MHTYRSASLCTWRLAMHPKLNEAHALQLILMLLLQLLRLHGSAFQKYLCRLFSSVWAVITKYHRLDDLLINNRNLFLLVLETRSLRWRHQHGQVMTLFWVANFSFPGPKAGKLCGASFRIALISFMKVPSSWSNHLPEAPPLKSPYWELEAQDEGWREGQDRHLDHRTDPEQV